MPPKKTDPWVRKFTDIIDTYWNDPDYQYLMHQAKSIQKEYKLDWHRMRQILKYAIEYENELPNETTTIGLYQYFPKYILSCERFEEQIRRNKEVEYVPDEVIKIKKGHYIGKEEEF